MWSSIVKKNVDKEVKVKTTITVQKEEPSIDYVTNQEYFEYQKGSILSDFISDLRNESTPGFLSSISIEHFYKFLIENIEYEDIEKERSEELEEQEVMEYEEDL